MPTSTQTTPQLTDRQAAALRRMLDRSRDVYDVNVPEVEDIAFTFATEYEPGRGHDLSFMFVTDEHVVQGGITVYGDGWYSVGDVSWVHNSHDDECPCGLGDCAPEQDPTDP